jgi:hypothetical protein
MIFAHPDQLYWGLLVIPLVILAYARRAGMRREPVATARIWAEALAQDRVRSAWLRWRHEASLIVQSAILASIVLALADPLRQPPQRIVAVLDNSSGATADGAAPDRLTAAKETVRRWIAGLRDCDGMAIVSTGSPAMVRCTMTGQRRTLEAALVAVQPVRGPACRDFALDLARRLLGDASAGRIMLVGCDDHGGVTSEADLRPPGPPIWPWLAGLAAALVVVEWCLCQRRWLD